MGRPFSKEDIHYFHHLVTANLLVTGVQTPSLLLFQSRIVCCENMYKRRCQVLLVIDAIVSLDYSPANEMLPSKIEAHEYKGVECKDDPKCP